jgi:hypothetical protein
VQNITGLEERKYTGNKWGGKYLRAPDIYWHIMEKCKDKLVPLSSVADVRRGFTTGCNDFFYLTKEDVEKWGIEEEFLIPVMKSPRDCSSILIVPNDLPNQAFICNKDRTEIKGTTALKYVEYGEKQNFHNITSCRVRTRWYEFPDKEWSRVLWPMIHGDRQVVFWNPSGVAVDHNLFEITNCTSEDIIWGSMFWTGQVMFRELHGRTNLGEGALKTEGVDIKTFYVLNSTDVSLASEINKYRSKIQTKNISSLEKELMGKVKRGFDDIIFDVLGLTQTEQDAVYEASLQLVRARIERAGSLEN